MTNARTKRPEGRQSLGFSFDPVDLRPLLLSWYQQHKRALPWRVLWARRGDPYLVWVSEIMLQQTVIKAVLPAYERFLQRFPDVFALARATEPSVQQAVRGLGYYRRFRLLHTAAKAIVAEGGAWPKTFAGWLELPGVGEYTAAAVSSIAFGFPAAVVDGNVERVFCRLLDLREPPNQPALKRQFKILAATFLDHAQPGDFNQALMELGQTVCTVTSPRCATCPLRLGCLARRRHSQALAPAPKTKAAFKDVAMRLVIIHHQGKIGLFPRPEDAKFLRHTAGFLTILADSAEECRLDGWESSGPGVGWHKAQSAGRVRHTITNHRIMASVECAALHHGTLPPGGRWVKPKAVEEQLVASLDRKAWLAYQRTLSASDPLP